MRLKQLFAVAILAIGLNHGPATAQANEADATPSTTTNDAKLTSPTLLPGDVATNGLPIGGGGLDPTFSAPSPTPPEKFATSPGGVDMRTGTFEYDHLDLSVGGVAEQGGLDLRRAPQSSSTAYRGRFGSFNHNWDITITEKRVKFYTSLYPSQFDYVISVNFGGRSTSFQARYTNIAPFTQLGVHNKASLTHTGTKQAAVYTYTANDGTIVKFRQISKECSSASSDGVVRRCAYASEVIVPSGQRYNLAYDSAGTGDDMARLRNVTSNSGHALVFEYNPPSAGYHLISKACALNLATSSMPATPVCPTSPQSVAAYTYNGVFMTAMTDASNAAYTFGRTGTGSPYAESYTRPGDTQPYLVNQTYPSPNPFENASRTISSQQFTDGPSYTYDWNEMAQLGEEPAPQIVGGSVTNNLGGMITATYGLYYSPILNDSSLNATTAPEKIIDELGRTTTAIYCPTGETTSTATVQSACAIQKPISVTYPDGNMALFEYNSQKLPSKVTRRAKSGSGLADILELATYTCIANAGCNKPLTTTDGKGNVTNYTYDATHGGVLTETYPAAVAGGVRPQKRYTYAQFFAQAKNSSGVLVANTTGIWLITSTSECRTLASCAGTADETLTTFTYGAAGTVNQLLVTGKTIGAGDNSLSATTSWTYDAAGNKLTEDGALAGTADTTRWRYDSTRQVVGVIGPDPDGAGVLKHRATRNTYDAAGRLIKIEQGTVNGQSDTDWAAFVSLQTSETRYDIQGRKTFAWSYGATGGNLSLTQYSYDALGRFDCTAVRMNPALFVAPAFSGLPASACTLSTEGSEGPDRITKLTYNAASELIKTTVAYGTADQADDQSNIYTLNGKLASVTDAENNRTTFEFDGHDRLKKSRYPVAALGALSSSTTDYEELTYDANGNVTVHRKRDGQLVNFTYDALNRMTFKDTPNLVIGEYDVTTTYDNLSRPTNVTDTANNFVGSTYDALGRMTRQSSPYGNIDLAYDIAGRLTRVVHPDANYWVYTYNTSDLTAIRENATTIDLIGYGYDDLGRRTSIARRNGSTTPVATTSIAYDPVGRLKSYAQDLGGTANDLTVNGPGSGGTAITYNPASQLTGITRSNPTDIYAWTGHYNINRAYGTNGLNQLTSAGATALGYDGRGNLTSSGSNLYTYTSENRLATAPGGATLTYDPTGRLSRVVQGINDTKFEHLGPRLIIERNGAGTILRRYVHGPGDDEPVVWYEGASLANKRFLHTDERGSVIAITNATGASIATNKYDEYGIPQSSVGTLAPGTSGRFMYTGQMWIPELGLYYYKARFYSPTLGRFMQTDPIGYEDGINWYAYVGNDPINGADPSGQEGEGIVVTGARVARACSTGVTAAVCVGGAAIYAILVVVKSRNDQVVNGPRPATIPPPPMRKDDEAPSDAKDPNGAKAPGKPGEAEGFKDPPSGEKWQPGDKGQRGGWVDDKGNVWRPTGQAPGRAHAGPHWDVTDKNGNSTLGNRYPGGRARAHGN